jgi:flagellar biosynthesis protein
MHGHGMSALPGKDKAELAVALKYAPGDIAPKVVAKGRGLLAAEIIARAREHGVYVHESPELVALLAQVDIDRYIPPALYVAVAELLAWLYRLEHREEMDRPPRAENAIQS